MDSAEVNIIKAARLDSNACILKKDVAGVAKYWLNDFVQIAGDGSHTQGKTQLIKDWKYMFAQSSPVFERIPDAVKISEGGDLAWEQGTWNYKTAPYRGNYAAMWRKVNGKWLTQSELYVSLD